jgi:hypothetical protein
MTPRYTCLPTNEADYLVECDTLIMACAELGIDYTETPREAELRRKHAELLRRAADALGIELA